MVPYWMLSVGFSCWHIRYFVNKWVHDVEPRHNLHLCHFGPLVHVSLFQHSGGQWQGLANVNWPNNFVWWMLINTQNSLHTFPLQFSSELKLRCSLSFCGVFLLLSKNHQYHFSDSSYFLHVSKNLIHHLCPPSMPPSHWFFIPVYL